MKIMKLNEWKCDISIDDASVYVEPTGALRDMVEHFGLIYNPSTDSYVSNGDVNLYDYYYDLSVIEQGKFDKAFVRNGKIAIRFEDVKGDFILPGDEVASYILTSLEGCPKTVGGDFYCGYNQLTSLEGCPESVGGSFSCSHNQLTSLNGCPKKVNGSFDCSDNQLNSLECCPESVGRYFDCGHNRLTSLKGCPKKVDGSFICYYNQLTSLEGCPESVGGDFWCNKNKANFTEDDVSEVCDVKKNIYVRYYEDNED